MIHILIHSLGPKTNSVEMITKLRNAGLNVVRMNFSHGTYEVISDNKTWHAKSDVLNVSFTI